MAVQPSGPEPRPLAPRLVTDLTWSLQPWPLTVTVADQEAKIPALSAAEWLLVLLADPPDLEAIFPGLADAEDLVDEALIEGRLTFEELNDLVLAIVTTVSARPWYVTFRLLFITQEIWDTHGLGGELALHGVDAANLSLSAWLDAVLATIVKLVDPKQLSMFYARLELPPVMEGVEQKPAELEMSRDQFMTLMAN